MAENPLEGQQPAQTPAQIEAEKKALGPSATTDPTVRQYFDVSNGDGTFRQVNAWGEEKGSTEDKKRTDKASAA
jgi:hypothetical protein